MNKTLKRLTETAVMLGLATVLSLITVFKAPFGGAVTAASMVPIVLIAFRYKAKWGLLTGLLYGCIQLALDFGKIGSWGLSAQVFAGSVLLDYLLAFTVIGVAGFFAGKKFGIFIGTLVGLGLRFVCHFLSGVILFSSFAPEGMSPIVYSILYNGAYMLPEIIVTGAVAFIIQKSTSFLKA